MNSVFRMSFWNSLKMSEQLAEIVLKLLTERQFPPPWLNLSMRLFQYFLEFTCPTTKNNLKWE